MAGKRVLITGISKQLPDMLARTLEDRDDVDELIGVDVREPRSGLRRTRFVRADIRDAHVARTIASAAVDTVVHLSVMPAPGAGGRARMKEHNVIGTMQLLGSCQRASALRRLVVRSSTAVYGSAHTAPALIAEEATSRPPPQTGLTKDLAEMEGYARSFGRRREDVTVTILRFANLIGGTVDSLLARYFSLPVVPTILGYDPRLQFCHPEDAVAVLVASIMDDHPGTYNVAGPGVVYLSQAVRMAGRMPAPLPLPLVRMAGSLGRRARRVDYSPEQLEFLRFGRVADITRLRRRFGYEPRWTTRQAFETYLAGRRLEAAGEATQPTEVASQLFPPRRRRSHDRPAPAREDTAGQPI